MIDLNPLAIKREFVCPRCDSEIHVVETSDFNVSGDYRITINTELTHVKRMSYDCVVFMNLVRKEQESIVANVLCRLSNEIPEF